MDSKNSKNFRLNDLIPSAFLDFGGLRKIKHELLTWKACLRQGYGRRW
jgi:hypothetical protein